MRITKIRTNEKVYSSNVYLIRGEFNGLKDVNTLVDTGGDGSIVDEIKKINTGAGKTPVAQIVLTHTHFDHTGGVKALKAEYNLKILACSREEYVDVVLKNGDIIFMGDRQFEVIHTGEHSQDSICLYGWEDRVLFSGDVPVDIKSSNGSYSRYFLSVLERLATFRIDVIYPGHGDPLHGGAKTILKTLENVKNSKIIED